MTDTGTIADKHSDIFLSMAMFALMILHGAYISHMIQQHNETPFIALVTITFSCVVILLSYDQEHDTYQDTKARVLKALALSSLLSAFLYFLYL